MPGLTSAQKGYITQFMNFTQADKKVAERVREYRRQAVSHSGGWVVATALLLVVMTCLLFWARSIYFLFFCCWGSSVDGNGMKR